MARDLEWLQESFQALDRVFFLDFLGGQGVTIAWLRWRPSKSFRFGAYYSKYKQVRINQALAHDWVPEGVVLLNIYHEMLHARLGDEHSAEFHLAEQRYPHYASSLAWEHDNHEKLLKARRPWPARKQSHPLPCLPKR